MAKSAYLAQAFAAYVSSKGATAMPAIPGLYLALFSGGVEASYSGYVRQSITAGTASGGVWSNTNDIVFPADAAAAHTWQEYRVYDSQSGGNMLYDETSVNVSDPINEAMEFKSGTVTVTEA